MNHNHYSFGLTALLMFICQSLSANDFKVDGIYYTYLSQSDKTVSVTYRGIAYFDNRKDYSGNVVIPPTVTYQGMTYSVTSIGDNAFRGCTELTSIEIPDNVSSIGEGAFQGCSGLTKIEIPSSVESIGNVAFCGCTGLTSTEIPNSVASIGYRAFDGCTGTLVINCDIEDCEDTGVISSFLAYCAQFSEVILGEEVNKVGRYAFCSVSSMKSLTIGSNVNSIGSYAFDRCTGLTSIYCNAINPPACSFGVFDMDTQKNCTLYVPSGSIDAYKAANAWKDFLTIEENSNVTALESISVMDNQNAPLYNLQGTQVVAPRPDGLYIRNGKKVMMK